MTNVDENAHMKLTTEHAWLTAILVMCALLSVFELAKESFWFDELLSVYHAKSLTFDQLIRHSRPLYYVILKVWLCFGSEEGWLRVLNLPFALGSVYLVYKLIRPDAGPVAALCAAALIAVSPAFLERVREARMYPLSIFTGLCGSLAAIRLLQRPTIKRALLWAFCRVLSVLSSPLNLCLLAADLLAGFIIHRKNKHSRKVLLMGTGAIVILCGIAVAQFIEGVPAFMDGWIKILPSLSLRSAVEKPLALIAGKPSQPFLSFCLATITGVCIFCASKQRALYTNLLLLWAFLPLTSLLLWSVLWRSVWVERYLIVASPYLLALLAIGLSIICRRNKLYLCAFLLPYLPSLLFNLHLLYTSLHNPDWRGAFQLINKAQRHGDVVVVDSFHSKTTPIIDYYYRGAAPVYRLSRKHGPPNQPDLEPDNQVVIEDLPSEKTIWLVYHHDTPPDLSFLSRQHTVRLNVPFPQDVTVLLLAPRAR